MAERFPNVINSYINVDGEQTHYRSLKGCEYEYRFSGLETSTRTFTLDATAGSGYEFDHWEFAPEHPFDDISSAHLSASKTGTSQDPLEPYRITVICYFKSKQGDSAIDLKLIGVPPNVGSLIGGGLRTGAVGSSVTYTAIAELLASMKGRYRFSHWLDDENVQHKEKSFSKTFSFKNGYTPQNPEIITFYAYFIECTGLVLYLPSNNKVLYRQSNDKILRDE